MQVIMYVLQIFLSKCENNFVGKNPVIKTGKNPYKTIITTQSIIIKSYILQNINYLQTH